MEPVTAVGAGTNFVMGMGLRAAVNTLSDMAKTNHKLKMIEKAAAVNLDTERLLTLVGGEEKFKDRGSKRMRRLLIFMVMTTVLWSYCYLLVADKDPSVMVPELATQSVFWSLINPFRQGEHVYVSVSLLSTIAFRLLEIAEIYAGFYVVSSNK